MSWLERPGQARARMPGGRRRVISLDAWERGQRGGEGAEGKRRGEVKTNVTQSHSCRPGLSPPASRSDTGPSEINSGARTEVADITHPPLRDTQLLLHTYRSHHLLGIVSCR